MAKKSAKKRAASRLSLLKQPKVIIAVIFILGFAVIGVKQLRDSRAAQALPATYYFNSGGIQHQTGFYKKSEAQRIGGVIKYNVNLWRWPKGTEDAWQTTRSMWFGPYTDIYIPPPYEGLHVCYYYSAWDEFGHTDTKIKVYIDMRFDGERDYLNEWTPPIPAPSQPESILTDGLLYGYIPTMRSHCYNYVVTPFEGRHMRSVEFRLKVLGSSDKNNSHIDLYKITVAYH